MLVRCQWDDAAQSARPPRRSYAIEKNVCYLVLCQSRFPKDNAFMYLEDISREFDARHGDSVNAQGRAYGFIAFDQYLQKRKRDFTESGGTRSNLNKVNSELHTVQRIMQQNIEDVMQRCEYKAGQGGEGTGRQDGSQGYSGGHHDAGEVGVSAPAKPSMIARRTTYLTTRWTETSARSMTSE